MDIGDIIFFLIIIGLPLVQWLTRKKEGDESLPEEEFPEFEPGNTPDTPYGTKRDISDPNREWEDLMEALGRPTVQTETAPPSLQPEPEPVMATPPPVPEPEPLPELDSRVERMNRALRESRASRQKLKKSRASTPTVSSGYSPELHTMGASRIQKILRSPQSIRDAILVNEILGQPVSMRNLER
jgi:hypothetical protein